MPDPAQMLDQAQWLVLGALCGSDSGVCSTSELALAVGDGELAELAVAGLHAVVSCAASPPVLCAPRPRRCVRANWRPARCAWWPVS